MGDMEEAIGFAAWGRRPKPCFFGALEIGGADILEKSDVTAPLQRVLHSTKEKRKEDGQSENRAKNRKAGGKRALSFQET